MQPLVTKDSLSIEITPINWAARPGFNYAYNVNMENVGTTILNTNCSIKLDTSKYIFDSTNNTSFSFNGNTLQASFSNAYPAQNINCIVYGKLKPTASLGSNLMAIATANGGAATAADTANTIIRGSYDPNDKQATPNLSVAQVSDNTNYIDYTIRFQNTGTDTAFTVVVADTLDATKLQINTLQLTNLSHNCKVTQNDNMVYFEFRDINLPDSHTNKIGSNGFVSFKVKPLTSLGNGNIVPNKAAIYFDYNSPIITNKAITTIGALPLTLLNLSAATKDNNILVYWNTANEINTATFILEVSTNAKDFSSTKEVEAKGNGNNSYFTSIINKNVNFIRLKMLDKNGKFTYSNIVKITSHSKENKIIISSINKNKMQLQVGNNLHNTKATIVTSSGKVVQQFKLQQGFQTIDIAALQIGVYFLQTENGVEKFVVE